MVSVADLLFEIFGWTGVFMMFLAYFLITSERITNTSGAYISLNIVGSIFVAVNAFFNSAYPSLAGNILWMMIAVYGLSRVRRSRTNKKYDYLKIRQLFERN